MTVLTMYSVLMKMSNIETLEIQAENIHILRNNMIYYAIKTIYNAITPYITQLKPYLITVYYEKFNRVGIVIIELQCIIVYNSSLCIQVEI